MICVYPADCTDFSTNGNGTLAPLSAEVTETLNGEYELTLVHPIDETGKWKRLVEGCILRAPVPAAMTPRVNFTAPGDDNRTEVWRVNTDFSSAETRKGTLRLRSGPGTKSSPHNLSFEPGDIMPLKPYGKLMLQTKAC